MTDGSFRHERARVLVLPLPTWHVNRASTGRFAYPGVDPPASRAGPASPTRASQGFRSSSCSETQVVSRPGARRRRALLATAAMKLYWNRSRSAKAGRPSPAFEADVLVRTTSTTPSARPQAGPGPSAVLFDGDEYAPLGVRGKKLPLPSAAAGPPTGTRLSGPSSRRFTR